MTLDAELPAGWSWATLEEVSALEVGAITDGPFGSNLKTQHYTEAGPRVVRLQNIAECRFVDERAHIAREHFERLKKHEVRRNDVLIALLGEVLPRACITPASLGPAIVKADCVRFRANEEAILPSFAMYALNSEKSRRQTAGVVHGVGRPRLKLSEVRKLLLPVAPRNEQRGVVEAIDSYNSRLDDAVASLERVRANLKRYRASVLKAAVEGRLVPTEAELARQEGRDYEPASVLLERILAERRRRFEEVELARMTAAGNTRTSDGWRKKYGAPEVPDVTKMPALPDGWCWTSVDTAGDVLLGRQRAPQFLTGRYAKPYLRVANVKDDVLDLSDVKEMDFDAGHLAKYRLLLGDIVVSEGQSPELVGQSAIYEGGIADLCFQKTLHRFRPLEPLVSGKFAQAVFRAWVKSGLFRRLASLTVNVAHLTLERFRGVPFPLPPASEQSRIVEALDARMTEIAAAENYVAASMRRIERLRQAILRYAFEGKLVDQDPHDEPASVLLERIRSGRQSVRSQAPERRGKRIRHKASLRGSV